jgi:hypothetical protein
MTESNALKLKVEYDGDVYGHVVIESCLDSIHLDSLLDFIRKATEEDNAGSQDDKWKSLEHSFNEDFIDEAKQHNALEGFKKVDLSGNQNLSCREQAIQMLTDKIEERDWSIRWVSEIGYVSQLSRYSEQVRPDFSLKMYSSSSNTYARNIFGINNLKPLKDVDYVVFVNTYFKKIWAISALLFKRLYNRTDDGLTAGIRKQDGYELYVGNATMDIDEYEIDKTFGKAIF